MERSRLKVRIVPLNHHLLRDDIRCVSATKFPNGDDRRALCSDLSGCDFLESKIDMGGNIDGVNSRLRHRAVAARTLHRNPEQCAACHN